jgi:hypothetical protein
MIRDVNIPQSKEQIQEEFRRKNERSVANSGDEWRTRVNPAYFIPAD